MKAEDLKNYLDAQWEEHFESIKLLLQFLKNVEDPEEHALGTLALAYHSQVVCILHERIGTEERLQLLDELGDDILEALHPINILNVHLRDPQLK